MYYINLILGFFKKKRNVDKPHINDYDAKLTKYNDDCNTDACSMPRVNKTSHENNLGNISKHSRKDYSPQQRKLLTSIELTNETLVEALIKSLSQTCGSQETYFESLAPEEQRLLQEDIIKANKEEAEDSEYQKELSAWNNTVSDGLKF